MIQGFWKNLKKPILALAPMADVTDAAFRYIINKHGKPDIFWTEFVSVDGLNSAGREKLLVDFWHTKGESPIVAQIFGSKPENFCEVAKLIRTLGFDGIDINMGCPDRSVEKQGAGAALIKTPELAKEIILATKKGAGDLPVSVKTRIGYNKVEIDTWFPVLAAAEPAAITIHGRTRKEMSLVPAHWDLISYGAKLIKSINKDILVLGNGDVKNIGEAGDKAKEFDVDGVMIGRGIFGNPWLFNKMTQTSSLPLPERLSVMLEHTILFEQLFSGIKSFDVMKKHYKAYVNGFDGAKELRNELFNAKNSNEVVEIVVRHYPSVVVPKPANQETLEAIRAIQTKT
jgi:nifR3 family TIM-barrel protein